MNKYELINTVLVSDLKPEDKPLLIELIMRADEHGYSWPSVERLCKVRGIKHEKNFKGAENYLPGLVTKSKKGRRNTYTLNVPAILALAPKDVVLRHTPSVAGLYTPSTADNTPSVADNTPSVEGANSTKNNTKESKEESTITTSAAAPVVLLTSLSQENRAKYSYIPRPSLDEIEARSSLSSITRRDTPAMEGVSEEYARRAVKLIEEIGTGRKRPVPQTGEW